VPTPPLLDQLDIALRDCVPHEPVTLSGEWAQPSRRTYKSEPQLGTGAGPFADVIDLRWRGTMMATGPVSGLAFLLTPENLYWAKAPDISPLLSVDISLHAYADYMTDRATFTANIAGAYLPGVPVSVGPDLAQACTVGPSDIWTGRLTRLAQVNSAAVFVLILQRRLLKVGRKRLWHVRDDIASFLTPDIRDLLTRRRTGTLRRQRE
jgi:hypothetical protein